MKDLKKVRVMILTSNYRILGDISLSNGVRLTDHISSSKSFVAITNAEVSNLNGNPITNASFMDVNRDRIELIIPEEQQDLHAAAPMTLPG